jgi:hypothetical protein
MPTRTTLPLKSDKDSFSPLIAVRLKPGALSPLTGAPANAGESKKKTINKLRNSFRIRLPYYSIE